MFEKQREIAKAVLGIVHTVGVGAIVGGIAAIATRNVYSFSTILNTAARVSGFISTFPIADKVVEETSSNMDAIVDGVFDKIEATLQSPKEQPKFTVIG